MVGGEYKWHRVFNLKVILPCTPIFHVRGFLLRARALLGKLDTIYTFLTRSLWSCSWLMALAVTREESSASRTLCDLLACCGECSTLMKK